MTTNPSAPPARAFGPAFREGFLAPRDGLRYLLANPGLWAYAVWPIVLNVLITAVLLAVLVAAAVWFLTYLHPRFPAGWLGVAAEVAVAVGLLVAALGLAAGAWVLLHGALTGYFHARLARAVEIRLGAAPDGLREVSWWYQAADGVRDAAALVGVNVGLLALNVVPVLGSIAATAGGLTFDCYLFGADTMHLPLDLRGRRRDEKRAFCWQHRAHVLGLGAAVLLGTLIPVIGGVVTAAAAVGAVLLHRRLAAQPEPPSVPT